jgi:hypothetical protein
VPANTRGAGSGGSTRVWGVDVIQLGGVMSPGLSYPVIHLSDSFDHLVRTLPFGQEFTFRRGNQDQYQVPWTEDAQLGSHVVDPRLGLLCSP